MTDARQDEERRYREDNAFERTRDGVTLELRIIGPFELPNADEIAEWGQMVAIMRRAVTGWRGVEASRVIPGGAGELPFKRLYTNGVCNVYRELALDAYIELARRVEQREDHRKNFASTSPVG